MKSEGALNLKGLSAPIDVLLLNPGDDAAQSERRRHAARQDIRFATSGDGTRIAWTETGTGQTIVKAPNWIQHLEYDWTHSPLDGWLPHLSRHYRLIRSDGRNNGLSDRGVADVSFDRFVDDPEALFDASGITRAPVFGMSLGAVVATAFAARHPERVSGLILMSGFVQGLGKRNRPQAKSTTGTSGRCTQHPLQGEPPLGREVRHSPSRSQPECFAFTTCRSRPSAARCGWCWAKNGSRST